VVAGALPDDPSDATEAAELRLLEILLDALHRGVEATADRLVDDVKPLIQAGHRHARCALLNAMQQLLLVSNRVDESLRLLRLGRIADLEQLTGVVNLLGYARPNVFTVAGEERVGRCGPDQTLCRCYRRSVARASGRRSRCGHLGAGHDRRRRVGGAHKLRA
jgi:hypothetical protein